MWVYKGKFVLVELYEGDQMGIIIEVKIIIVCWMGFSPFRTSFIALVLYSALNSIVVDTI
jgi:hypothetical protein